MNDRSSERSFLTPNTEKRLLQLLQQIGIMFGGQIQAHKILHHTPRTARTILARLKKEYKIVEHTMTVGGKDYRIYTLGPRGAVTLGVSYRPDYWLNYTDSETVQRLMAVDLYMRMCDYLSASLIVRASESPYIFTFVHGDKAYQVGVVWDNAVQFSETYRWSPPKERVILVCQSINQVNDLLKHLEEYTPIRITTRNKLREGLVFYKPENGRWVLDIPERQIKTKIRIVHKHRILLP
ncbi:hypothetical protein CEB3_c13830 [Peptococcaceae bacterium CEB3]|nr:hypothetical protein CEB3_c13830 [Peptococcaceae bacterium CEB3]